MRALVVAAGEPPDRAALDATWPGWAAEIGLVVAADAGAATAERLGLRPDLAVGDFDSLGAAGLAALVEAGIPVEPASPDKDESDTELAVRAALARGATELTIVGGLGGRPDHLLANLGLLALPALEGLSVELVDGSTRVSLLRGRDGAGTDGPAAGSFRGRVGDLVSLLPLGPGVDGVTTEGLRWPLRDEALPVGPARGLSNVRVSPVASVAVRRGLLLVIETTGPAATSARLPP